MPCGYCGDRIEWLAFKCHQCGMSLCVNCRLPENHECTPVTRCLGTFVYKTVEKHKKREKDDAHASIDI
jgi:predicted nucleic acid binding AN1-type Zn finger protein